MQDLVCPHCNKAFKIDETGYTDLVAQVRNNEFSKAVNERLSQAEKDKDFYATLGVTKEASSEEIKKAYKKLARENHPDLNPGDTEAEKKFKEISEASSVLGDEKKRQEYDQVRAMGASGFGGFGGQGFNVEDFFLNLFFFNPASLKDRKSVV